MVTVVKYDDKYLKDLYRLYCSANNGITETEDEFRFQLKNKKVKILKIDDRVRGYIFFSNLYKKINNDRVSIDEIYIEKKYDSVQNYQILVESIRRKNFFKQYKYAELLLSNGIKNNKIVSKLHLTLDTKLYEMKLYTNKNYEINKDNKIDFFIFKKGIDEPKRVSVQNLIFKDTKDHIDCTVDDILYEEKQDYFMEDGCIFLTVDNNIAGYSQIILYSEPYLKPYIINFGIVKEYRGMRLSKILLNYTLNTAKNKGFKEIYLMVNAHNKKAYNLYSAAGFKRINSYHCYLYKFKE